jgi:hypothetical protein
METMDFNKALDKALEAEFVSPYKLAKIASDLVGREVIPQLVYSYCNKGLIKASKNSTGHWQVSRTNARAWLTKYVPKHQIG